MDHGQRSRAVAQMENLAARVLFKFSIVLGCLTLALHVANGQERVRAGYSGISGYQVPLWMGVDLGLFKKYGVNLEPVLFRGGAESTSALTANEIQFDVVSPQPHIAADLSGADIIIIGTYFNKHTYSLVARSTIKSPQDLRGKKIGVLSPIGLNQIVVNTALKHWRIDEKSVTLIRAGGSRDRLAALQSGLIDATVLTGAFVERARAAGMTVLLDLGDLEDSFPTVSLMTNRSFQAAKRPIVKGFLEGVAEASYVFRDRPRAGSEKSREVDAHPGPSDSGNRLQELCTENLAATVHGNERRPDCRRRSRRQPRRRQRTQGAGVRERRRIERIG